LYWFIKVAAEERKLGYGDTALTQARRAQKIAMLSDIDRYIFTIDMGEGATSVVSRITSKTATTATTDKAIPNMLATPEE
jgi:hypothetical protein